MYTGGKEIEDDDDDDERENEQILFKKYSKKLTYHTIYFAI